MIIIDPLTFKPIRIDEKRLSKEDAELVRRINSMQKKIAKLQRRNTLAILSLEKNTRMRFGDILKKLRM